MHAYWKEIPSIGMQLHVMSLRTIWSFFSIWVIHKCQSGICFLTSVRTVKFQLIWIKYWWPVKYLVQKNMEVKLAMCIKVINFNKGTRLASEVW